MSKQSIAGVTCGRKFCSKCRRWRIAASDFNVRRWRDDPLCTQPQTLQSRCRRCIGAAKRETKGYGLSQARWFGRYDTAEYREHRKAKNRESYRKRMKKKRNRDKLNEYRRIRRHALVHSRADASLEP